MNYCKKLNEQLLPRFDESLFVAFDDPVPENRELKLQEDTEHVKANIRLINEIREERGWEPTYYGDVPWMDSRLTPVMEGFEEEAQKPEEPPVPPGEVPEEEEEEEALASRAKKRLREMLG